MHIVQVLVHVKPERIEDFLRATVEIARQSLEEPGVARFDVLRQLDDPHRFLMVEVYRTAEDPARHKETAHYRAWRDTVAEMMATPRSAMCYSTVFPDDSW
ncbi:MAG: antibiotic biosynthesis monooxygenase [Deltaproteobacteria bacterium]|nr:antibiotic biosynthesis monooxygenase [Deltaproteobacteria bacterium]